MTSDNSVQSPPLSGVRVVEFAGLGPTPFAAMMLADMGADVVRIERPNAQVLIPQKPDFLNRSRRYVELDLKSADGLSQAKQLVAAADMLIEGMRPGVMEKLGLGPEQVHSLNAKLVYGRMTGWGQTGPLSQTAGHDINYIAISGALHAIGTAEAPIPPLNLLGDFGGGSLYLVNGMLAALIHAGRTGNGQVVDAAIVDGAAHLMTMMYSLANSGLWSAKRAKNLLDGGAPYYGVYACKDGGHLAVGALEPQFYAALCEGLDLQDLPDRNSPQNWPALREALTNRIAEKTRDDWASTFAQTDACATPVLTMEEAMAHPHNAERGVFTEVNGAMQPAAAPRLSDTPFQSRDEVITEPADLTEILDRWGKGTQP